MSLYDVLDQIIALLRQRQRLTYRLLKREFALDDETLEDLKAELIQAQRLAKDENEAVLVWTGDIDSIPNPALSMNRRQESESRFQALLPPVIALLRSEGRVTYRTLAYVFDLDQRLLTEIRKELHFRRLAIDEGGEGLVWTGKAQLSVTPAISEPSQQVPRDAEGVTPPVTPPLAPHVTETATRANRPTTLLEPLHTDIPPNDSVAMPESSRHVAGAERRQLTVMFCDLAGSTELSSKLDSEDLREVIRAYQESAAEVIQEYEGHIAQYLGDGLLIYFGWPQAHENDAERAVYTGLDLPEAIDRLNKRLEADHGEQLAVRIGIHTGPVVVGEIGGGGRHENLALGETPNIAARLEGLAKPNTFVISPVTAQLVQRSFVLEELGLYELKGVAEPMMLYAVVGTRETDYDEHEEMLSGGFDALVGRDEEIGLLLRRWEQSKDGQGQVVLISGEAGLGKSSLVEGLRSYVRQEGMTRITFRCSPYTTNSAMQPVIEHIQRVLGWEREDSTEAKLDKLEQAIQHTSLLAEETVPLLAALLSLPVPEDRYAALTLSPQRQRQLTQDALVAWMLEEAERQPVLAVWEDLHWADPSTLELLGLFVEQTPTVPMMNVLAFRPEFVPPWPMQSHMTPITLNRLERTHIEVLVRQLAGGKRLPTEVETHIVTKTDGVPLYVEELTKMLLESDLLEENAEQYVLTGSLSDASIPATLQDSLMARLDRLPEVREVAQLGAVLGREFDYEMIQSLAALDESTLQAGLRQLVDTELLYQRGRIPRAKYIFRHVLIRDAAYQSLLRRTRQQYHHRIAQVLEEFPETAETQPELVAHHYAQAGLNEPAVSYLQKAGEQAAQRSANVEAISHLNKGLELLKTLPGTPARVQQELDLQVALGPVLMATKGHAASDVERAYARARELCQQIGDTPQLFQVLRGLWHFYLLRMELQTARELGENLLALAQDVSDLSFRLETHYVLGNTLNYLAEFAAAQTHFAQGINLYDPQRHRDHAFRYGLDPGISCRVYAAFTLWCLGYPDQAVKQSHEVLTLAHERAHPYSLAFALFLGTWVHHFRREWHPVQERAQACIDLTAEHGFLLFRAGGTILRGWALTAQLPEPSAGQAYIEKGITQIEQGLMAWHATGAEALRPYGLALLAEAHSRLGQHEDGLTLLAEALAMTNHTEERRWEAELYRLKGQLLLQQSPDNTSEAEACFHQAISIAQHQSAKSWELRAATSLARLWQSQGKRDEARELLESVYSWFTEGFDTADLIDAKTLLDELS